MRDSAGASFEFFSDPEGKLLDLLDARHVDGRYDGEDIAQSSNFLISHSGEVLWAHRAENYRERVKPEALLRVIDERL